jgi:hypothetical protein
MSSLPSTAPKRGGWLQSVRAVAWSFIGLRSRAGMTEDMDRLHPLQVVAVGIVGAIVFVVALAMLAKWIAG